MKIGVPKEFFQEGLDSEVKDAMLKAMEDLKELGATVEEIIPSNNRSWTSCLLYYIFSRSKFKLS